MVACTLRFFPVTDCAGAYSGQHCGVWVRARLSDWQCPRQCAGRVFYSPPQHWHHYVGAHNAYVSAAAPKAAEEKRSAIMMEESRPHERDLRGMIACLMFLVLGAGIWWASGDYSPLGAVFPRTIATLMMLLSL